ncbi:hypothetical protein [Horticoccus sp. 23ND18S-11]
MRPHLVTHLLVESDVMVQTFTTFSGINQPHTFTYPVARKPALCATLNF